MLRFSPSCGFNPKYNYFLGFCKSNLKRKKKKGGALYLRILLYNYLRLPNIRAVSTMVRNVQTSLCTESQRVWPIQSRLRLRCSGRRGTRMRRSHQFFLRYVAKFPKLHLPECCAHKQKSQSQHWTGPTDAISNDSDSEIKLLPGPRGPGDPVNGPLIADQLPWRNLKHLPLVGSCGHLSAQNSVSVGHNCDLRQTRHLTEPEWTLFCLVDLRSWIWEIIRKTYVWHNHCLLIGWRPCQSISSLQILLYRNMQLSKSTRLPSLSDLCFSL